MANLIFSIDKKQANNSDVYTYDYVYADIDMNSKQQNDETKFKIKKLYDVAAIKNSIHNIFTWQKGERILDPQFGTQLKFYLYEGITQYNTEQIISEIRSAIMKYEPRVNVEQVINITNNSNIDDNAIHLEVIYSIPSLSKQRYNESIIIDKSHSL